MARLPAAYNQALQLVTGTTEIPVCVLSSNRESTTTFYNTKYIVLGAKTNIVCVLGFVPVLLLAPNILSDAHHFVANSEIESC